ncbi:MAG TPA: hypothetical protein VGQ67_15790, partial [Candidatus Polarisedimenticolia bacterium]|nr:hypothetical protein [Candidatus Polarisedimenticolia bacterium]
TLVFTVGMTPPTDPTTSYILDLDLGTIDSKSPDFSGAEAWIEKAHTDIESVFESSLTDAAKALFSESSTS